MNNEIVEVLQAASSQNVDLIKLAEEKLKSWETTSGFAALLLNVYMRQDLELPIRWMAIICLKNSVIKFWRKHGPNCLSKEEKQSIRDKIITCLDEPSSQLAVQLAVVIAKIVRVDVQIWPEAIQITLENVKSEDSLLRHRSLLTLNRIMHELASKRLMSDRRVFQQISSSMFAYLYELGRLYSASLASCDNNEDRKKIYDMYILLSKVLRKLLIYGERSYPAESTQAHYVHNCFENVAALLHSEITVDDGVQEKREKLIILFMKVFRDSIEHQPMSFVHSMEPGILLCLKQIFSSNSNSQFKTLLIYCGNLLKNIMRAYKKPIKLNSERSMALLNADAIKEKHLTVECIEKLCDYIIFNYFPLTQHDFEEWEINPEEYTIVEAGESHKFLLTPCMEALFVVLFYEYKTIVIPKLINCTKMIVKMPLENITHEDTLNVCAVFKALGLSAYELFDELDFDILFENTLLNMLKKNDKLLHQHIIWLAGQWINVKFSNSNRITLYRVILHFLQNESDLVIKITSCKTLRIAIDDFDFQVKGFQEFAKDIFVELCKLLVMVELCDLKMIVLNVISLLVERLGCYVGNNLEVLIFYIPKLWEISVEHNLLRGAVINVLVHVVKGLGNTSNSINNITLPIITFSTSVDQPAHIYLLEDGLELYLVVLQNSAVASLELLNMFSNILVLLERASETLDTCLSITKAYLLLDSIAFLKVFSNRIYEIFKELLGNIKETAARKIVSVIKIAVLLAPNEAISSLKTLLLLFLDYIIRDTNGAPLMIEYISIFAYICLCQQSMFNELICVYATRKDSSFNNAMENLVAVWLDKVDFMPLEHKKLTALALCSLLPHKAKFVFDKFALILDLCVNVMYELQKESGPVSITDFLVSDCAPDNDEDKDYEEVSMKNQVDNDKKLIAANPIHTIVLLDFTREKLAQCKQSFGEQLFKEAMETMDAAVAKQLLSLIN